MPSRGAGVIARARYRFDLALSRGPLVVIGYLGLVTLVVIVVATVLLATFRLAGVNGGGRLGFAEAFWQSLERVLDTGTFASDRDWPTRFVTLFVTLSGIFLAGSLIGLIANAVDQQVEKLRKGRSDVLESGHTVVLGWSPRLPTILSELVIANSNQRSAAFVVLAGRAKDEMEDDLRRLVPDTGCTRVVCRTGDTGSVDDLRLVNIEGARSVIVLADERGDAGVVKAVLAVRSIDPGFARVRLVAEMDDTHHADTLRTLTDNKIATVRADDVIGQVTAQACHQDGLAAVFHDLLDFGGDEIYFAEIADLAGHNFREAVCAFDQASVIGLFHAGKVVLNPPPDQVIAPGDQVIAIAADDDCVVFTGYVRDVDVERVAGAVLTSSAQRIAVLGWSSLGIGVLRELDRFLGAGSLIDLLVDRTIFAAEDVALPEFERCTARVHALDPGPQALIEVLSGNHYDQAIVLGYRAQLAADQADARSMLTLLALERAFASDPKPPRVVAEMLDRANVAVAQTTGVDDFIVSDELSSLMIAQLSERLELQDVFRELFDAGGCSLALHPAPLYAPDHPTSYLSIVASGVDRRATVIGYRLGSAPAVLNPAKSSTVQLGAGDQVLVLALREGHEVAGDGHGAGRLEVTTT
jgi:Trk K+ transport system NAD-binding subunit